jgi:hypothetical protein
MSGLKLDSKHKNGGTHPRLGGQALLIRSIQTRLVCEINAVLRFAPKSANNRRRVQTNPPRRFLVSFLSSQSSWRIKPGHSQPSIEPEMLVKACIYDSFAATLVEGN